MYFTLFFKPYVVHITKSLISLGKGSSLSLVFNLELAHSHILSLHICIKSLGLVLFLYNTWNTGHCGSQNVPYSPLSQYWWNTSCRVAGFIHWQIISTMPMYLFKVMLLELVFVGSWCKTCNLSSSVNGYFWSPS